MSSIFPPTKRVSADFHTLMVSAPATAKVYFNAAIKIIDEEFGAGYSKRHPELIAAFMSASATDFSDAMTNLSAQIIEDGLNTVAEAINSARDVGAEAIISLASLK
jgi:hypothetical protein